MTTITQQNHPAKRFATVKQAAVLYPAFSESSFRWYIFNAKQNNFDKCIRRVGRKVLIELDQFERWVDESDSAF